MLRNMKDWKHCTAKEIEEMTFEEAREIVEKQIALGLDYSLNNFIFF